MRFDQEQYNQMKEVVQDVLAAERLISWGRIEDWDAATHSVRVRLLPQLCEPEVQNVTGFIPLNSPWVGTKWGMQCAPTDLEAHVLVFFFGLPFGPAFAVGPFYNQTNLAPGGDPATPVEKGEWICKHSSGTYIQLYNDGSVRAFQHDGTEVHLREDASVFVKQKEGTTFVIDKQSNVTLDVQGGRQIVVNGSSCNLNIDAELLCGSGAMKTVVIDPMITLFNEHIHSPVNVHADTTGPPTMKAVIGTHSTVITKAS